MLKRVSMKHWTCLCNTLQLLMGSCSISHALLQHAWARLPMMWSPRLCGRPGGVYRVPSLSRTAPTCCPGVCQMLAASREGHLQPSTIWCKCPCAVLCPLQLPVLYMKTQPPDSHGCVFTCTPMTGVRLMDTLIHPAVSGRHRHCCCRLCCCRPCKQQGPTLAELSRPCKK